MSTEPPGNVFELERSVLSEQQAELLAATRRWADGEQLGADTDALRHRVIESNHLRYVESIEVYRELAKGLGFAGATGIGVIVNELMLSDQVFKSYDPAWLESGDFHAMTTWLASLYSSPIDIDVGDVITLSQWRAALADTGLQLSYSSGTSGRMSFVPRDAASWKSLCQNARAYANTDWFVGAHGKPREFACLVAGPKGTGMGIQGAATGLARMATRAHYLFDTELDEDSVRWLTSPRRADAPGGSMPSSVVEIRSLAEQAYARAYEFCHTCQDDGMVLLVFGAPFQLRTLCEHFLMHGSALNLPTDSMVSTGGGWKSFQSERIGRVELLGLVKQSLGLEPGAVMDAYSTAELNCAFLSCPAGRYHIPPLIEPVVLDEAFLGQIGEGGYGRLGYLDPFADSYPGFIITGDLGRLDRGPCECGLTGWYLDGEIERAVGQEVKGCGGVLAAVLA